MIILFRGTDKSKNNAPHALAVCASISAIRFAQKTLILQLMTKHTIENLLVGKRLRNATIKAMEFDFEDTGIDALLRRVETQRLSKEHFDTSCLPALNSENALDIAEVSKKADFQKELLSKEDELKDLLRYAADVYDNIFILADGKDHEQLKIVNPLVDCSVTCVPQGNKEIYAEPAEKNYFLVTDFDRNSTYNVRYMKRQYNAANMNIMPYNVGFKDAYNTGTALQYILSNNQVDSTDANRFFVESMQKLTEKLMEGTVEAQPELTFQKRKAPVMKPPVLEDYGDAEVTVSTKKKGFLFKKNVTEVHVSIENQMESAVMLQSEEWNAKDGQPVIKPVEIFEAVIPQEKLEPISEPEIVPVPEPQNPEPKKAVRKTPAKKTETKADGKTEKKTTVKKTTAKKPAAPKPAKGEPVLLEKEPVIVSDSGEKKAEAKSETPKKTVAKRKTAVKKAEQAEIPKPQNSEAETVGKTEAETTKTAPAKKATTRTTAAKKTTATKTTAKKTVKPVTKEISETTAKEDAKNEDKEAVKTTAKKTVKKTTPKKKGEIADGA